MARPRVALPPPGSAARRPLSFARVERETQYARVPCGDLPGEDAACPSGGALRARAVCAASARVLRLDAHSVDLARTPRLRWRWRVEEVPETDDHTGRAGDDFAARVYVLFPPDPARDPWWRRMQRAVLERLYGTPLPGRALTYVWADAAEPGALWRNPFAEESAMLALRGREAERGVWRAEEVDVLADHRRAFGEAPSDPPAAVGVMSDSDQTCATAVAFYAGFAFVAAPR